MPILAACTGMPACMKLPLGAALFHERRAISSPALLLFNTVYLIFRPSAIVSTVCCLMLFAAMCVCLIRSIIKENRQRSAACVPVWLASYETAISMPLKKSVLLPLKSETNQSQFF